MNGTVYFIGAGPGDPGLLTLKGKEIIERADVIVYAGSLINREILSFARKDARIINSAVLTLEEITGEMVTAAKKGMTVARVQSGDPSVYGAIAEQMEALQKENIPCEVIPGVASVFAAAASLKMEYTLPGITQTLILTRRSGRTRVPDKESLSSLAGHRASMAIFLSIGMMDETVKELMAGGYPKDTPAAVVYRASWPDEKRVEGTLKTIAEKTKQEGITRQALIIVGEAVGRHKRESSKLYAPDFTHGFRVAKQDRRAGPAVVALTRRGWHTGRRILHAMDKAEFFLPVRFKEEVKELRVSFYEDINREIKRLFQTYDELVLIMATGIAVRIIAPFLTSKWEDPAVVTMDDSGRNIISLLSGHWGGANELVMKLSGVLGGNPVITTESDVMGFPSVDTIIKSLTAGRVLENKPVLRDIQTAILEGEDVAFYPKELCLFPDMKGHPNLHFFDSIEALVCSRCTAGLIVSHKTVHSIQTHKKFLLIHSRDLVVGIGCHKGINSEEIEKGIQAVFHDMNLSMSSIALLCSIEQKKGEKGLIDYAWSQDIPLKFFSSEEINQVKILSPDSKHIQQVMGVHGVAEPCATLGARDGKLLMHKVKLKNMTVAVAKLPLKQLIERE